ncbi:unnamed protein product, partial [Sphacelaria rigidula]
VEPANAKALFWRAKGLVSPASSGALELEEAIRDLARSSKLAPGDKAVRGLLNKLRVEKAKQKKADRATFSGLFARGNVVEHR